MNRKTVIVMSSMTHTHTHHTHTLTHGTNTHAHARTHTHTQRTSCSARDAARDTTVPRVRLVAYLQVYTAVPTRHALRPPGLAAQQRTIDRIGQSVRARHYETQETKITMLTDTVHHCH